MLPRIFACACAMALLAPEPALAGSPLGEWQTSAGDARYVVTRCGDELCARLIWLDEEARTEENVKYLNKVVVRARPVSETAWEGRFAVGGEDATGSIEMISPDRILVRGCNALMCRSLTFVRL